jgi:hypothetical protein
MVVRYRGFSVLIASLVSDTDENLLDTICEISLLRGRCDVVTFSWH